MLKRGELEGEFFSQQWIQFVDATGVHYAQPDAYLLLADVVLLFEIKLTQSDSAEEQMEMLYAPLLRHLYGLPVLCLQVCKRIRVPIGPTEVDHPQELLDHPRPGTFTWNWIG